jgi:hypothetical protein
MISSNAVIARVRRFDPVYVLMVRRNDRAGRSCGL